jgi:molybdenum cofactor cytidylyltransferase
MTKKAESGKFAAILLAAGPSSRLGQAKQLVKVGGESLVRRATRMLLNMDPVSLTVVTGFADDAVDRQLSELPVRLARNDDWEQGMGGSIACGARNISEDVDGVLITLCDQWRLEERDLIRLISMWRTDISHISTALWYEDKDRIYGPPALFPRKLIRELCILKGSRGAKALINQNLANVRFVEMSNAAYDLDRPEDLEQLLKRSQPYPSS